MNRIASETVRTAGRRRVRSWHLAALVLVLAVGGLLLYAFWPVLTGQEEAQRPEDVQASAPPVVVEAVVIQPVDFPLQAEATGTLTPWRETEVSAEVSGRVVERRVKEGDWVAAGQVLVVLDDTEARLALAEAEAALLKARSEYAVQLSQEGGEGVDSTRLAEARSAWQAAQEAYARGEIDEAKLDEARHRYEALLLLSGVQREAVRRVVTGLAEAEQRVARARLQLSRTRIRAPFAGRVADLQVEVGQHVGPGQVLLMLLDDRRMKVEVDVLEADLVHMRPGAWAWVRLPALGDTVVTGTVHTVNPRIDPKTGAGRVTVTVPNPEGRLLAGMFAYVALETRRLPDRLVVPAEAVLVRQGRDLVFVIRRGRAQWTYVTTGPRSGDYVVLLDGVAPGDTVAVSGHHALAHDAPVQVAAIRPAFLTMD
ncbi:MAG: efflux RND transporter periplasmic adaptor subunit [Rhodothermus sp.]|nr:efflux RND transporter periplasmic adaptor subunit [Rhodothermus sp.]